MLNMDDFTYGSSIYQLLIKVSFIFIIETYWENKQTQCVFVLYVYQLLAQKHCAFHLSV